MNKKELLKLLKPLPDDIPIWLGVNAGEGYTYLSEVFKCNALDAGLDLDEATHDEVEYIEDGFVMQDDWEVEDGDRVGKPIIILGGPRSKEDVDSNRFYRLRDKDAEAKETMKKQKEYLLKQLEEIDSALAKLK